jgi:hypothetical protein
MSIKGKSNFRYFIDCCIMVHSGKAQKLGVDWL